MALCKWGATGTACAGGSSFGTVLLSVDAQVSSLSWVVRPCPSRRGGLCGGTDRPAGRWVGFRLRKVIKLVSTRGAWNFFFFWCSFFLVDYSAIPITKLLCALFVFGFSEFFFWFWMCSLPPSFYLVVGSRRKWGNCERESENSVRVDGGQPNFWNNQSWYIQVGYSVLLWCKGLICAGWLQSFVIVQRSD